MGALPAHSGQRWRWAADFGLVGRRIRIDPKGDTEQTRLAPKAKPFEQVIEAWTELTVALNSINRSMGLRDLYPFVLSEPTIEKLRFISEVIAGSDASATKAAKKTAPANPTGSANLPASEQINSAAPALATATA